MDSFRRNVLKTQAICCEKQGHWAWAAILWKRIGEEKNALQCENIVKALAANCRIKLQTTDTVVVIDPDKIYNR